MSKTGINRAKQRGPRAGRWDGSDLREFETTPTPPVTVRSKGGGLTVKKKVVGTVNKGFH